MTEPMEAAAEYAEDEALARLVRERIAAGPSRPLTELAAELGIDLDELGVADRGAVQWTSVRL